MATTVEEKQVAVIHDEEEVTRNAELVTDALRRRLSDLGLCIPPVAVTGKADVIFHVWKSSEREEEEEEEEEGNGKEGVGATENGKETESFRILAHSSVLKRECDYFREILQEEEEEKGGEEEEEEGEDDCASMASAQGKVYHKTVAFSRNPGALTMVIMPMIPYNCSIVLPQIQSLHLQILNVHLRRILSFCPQKIRSAPH